MAEISLLDKLLIIDEWLVQKINREVTTSRVIHDPSTARVLESEHAIVRAQISELQFVTVKEAIEKQEAKS